MSLDELRACFNMIDVDHLHEIKFKEFHRAYQRAQPEAVKKKPRSPPANASFPCMHLEARG
jgi:hypothetical protein